jgi:hypothetical protein
MVETQLTPELIAEGAALVKKLDETGTSPDAALWFYFPDVGTWKLLLAEVKLGPTGPRDAYRTIQKTLQLLGNTVTHISLSDVAVAKPDAPIIRVLRRAIATGPGISGIRFTRNVIDGLMIEDAYIYRLAQPSAPRRLTKR